MTNLTSQEIIEMLEQAGCILLKRRCANCINHSDDHMDICRKINYTNPSARTCIYYDHGDLYED